MNFLGRTKNWPDYDMHEQLSRLHSQGRETKDLTWVMRFQSP